MCYDEYAKSRVAGDVIDAPVDTPVDVETTEDDDLAGDVLVG